jgi:hypothetical protein
MKKLPIILLIIVVSLSTVSCGLFSMIGDLVGGETVVEETEIAVLEPTEEVEANEEQPVGDSRVILFQDDFSDPNSGWDRNDWDNGTTDYANGVYQLAVKKEQYDVWANPYRYFEGDVSVEVDATKVSGEMDDDFGIQCRYSGEPSAPNYYFFYISSDGYAVIGKHTEAGTEYLSSDQMQPADAINQGYATNHLQADCIGSTLTLYVNGQMVAVATDSELVDGDVGLIAGTFAIPNAAFEFDNFVVYQP